MPSLSLCMIVKDEESTLKRCLESVEGIFDEIVVVDTGSSDRTKEVAASFGARIFDFKWIGDFSAARNFSFSKASSGHVMWLDADDVLLPADRDKLLSLKPSLVRAAYLMPYNYSPKADGGFSIRVYRHRIVPTGETRWSWPIHECLAIPGDIPRETTGIVVTHRRARLPGEVLGNRRPILGSDELQVRADIHRRPQGRHRQVQGPHAGRGSEPGIRRRRGTLGYRHHLPARTRMGRLAHQADAEGQDGRPGSRQDGTGAGLEGDAVNDPRLKPGACHCRSEDRGHGGRLKRPMQLGYAQLHLALAGDVLGGVEPKREPKWWALFHFSEFGESSVRIPSLRL
jgi:hypothetical protein